MKSPWKSIQPMQPDRDYYVFASSLPAKRLSATGRLFRGASAVRAQLEGTPGLVGFSLLASPLRKQYATLSVWEDEAALRTFATSAPHGQLMGELADDLGDTRFRGWTVRGAQGRPDWGDALQRLRRPA